MSKITIGDLRATDRWARSPGIAQRAGAGVSLRAGYEFAIELGEQGPLRREEKLHAERLSVLVAADRVYAWELDLERFIIGRHFQSARRPRTPRHARPVDS